MKPNRAPRQRFLRSLGSIVRRTLIRWAAPCLMAGTLAVTMVPAAFAAAPNNGQILVQPRVGTPAPQFRQLIESVGAREVKTIHPLEVHVLKVPTHARSAVIRALSRNPNISFASPSDGATVSGNVDIAASASDNQSVASISVFVDGSLLCSEEGDAVSCKWNSRKASTGTHSLTTRAVDQAGNSASSSITVNVSGDSGNGNGPKRK